MRVLLLLFFAFSVHAQSFQYRLEGSFSTSASTSNASPLTITLPDTTANTGTTSPTVVNYSINWNETSSSVQGIYQDNYFARSGPVQLSGTVTANGRTMSVILPQLTSNVRQIGFVLNVGSFTTGSVPINITTRDNVGSVIDSPSTFAMMSALPNATDEADIVNDDACVVGFGALSGMCGLYNGTFNEYRDTNERCSLLSRGNLRLDFGVNTTFTLIMNYIPGAPAQESHTIGTMLPSPQTNTINIAGRNCANLIGTSFPTGNCKTLNLSGTFRPDASQNYGFIGTYQIIDEVTGDSCAYEMNLTRESAY